MNQVSVAGSALFILMASSLIMACGTEEKRDTRAPLYEVAKSEHVPTSIAITIAQMKFTPDIITMERGDTLVFTNKDVVDHDATALPDSAWTSGPLHPGDSWKLVADKSTDYFCSIHVVMRGRINVK